jgi:hypothetical protein
VSTVFNVYSPTVARVNTLINRTTHHPSDDDERLPVSVYPVVGREILRDVAVHQVDPFEKN